MKSHRIQFVVVLLVGIALSLSSCKKEKSTPPTVDTDKENAAILTNGKWNVTGIKVKVDGGAWQQKTLTEGIKSYIQFTTIAFSGTNADKTSGNIAISVLYMPTVSHDDVGTYMLKGKTLTIDPSNQSAEPYTLETVSAAKTEISYTTDVNMEDPDGVGHASIHITAIMLALTH